MSLAEIEKGANQLRDFVKADKLTDAKSLLTQLKIKLLGFSSLPPCGQNSATADKERLIARNIYEEAAILSVKLNDIGNIERNITQLKVFYTDYKDLPESDLHYPIIGMRLLHLLVENRMTEFHGELENISDAGRSDANIAFAIKLEQYLMEGSYNKVLEARAHVPNPYYKLFMSQLLDTVRDAIADCVSVSYEWLSLDDVTKMLIFDSSSEFLAYLKQKKQAWTVKGDKVWFITPVRSLGKEDIPSLRLVKETLSYATELDRIV